MALKFIDQEGTEHTIYSNQEKTFRENYEKRKGSLKGWEKSLRQSKINQQIRETFGLSRAGSGLVTDRVAAPSDAEIRGAIRSEPQQVEQSFTPQNQSRPTQYAQPDEGFYQSGPVSIGLSLY